MKKIFISGSYKEKECFLKKIKNSVVVIPKSKKKFYGIECNNVLFLEDFSRNVLFLDFQSRINKDNTIIILDCLRYSTPNNTKYNKIYKLTEHAKNIVVIDSFPFVFNYRNLFIPLRILNEEPYSQNQYYDDNFMVELNGEMVRANSFKNILNLCGSLFDIRIERLRFSVHFWEHDKKEQIDYENHKKWLIYEKNFPKVKVVTWIQGISNRFESKLNALKLVLDKLTGKPTVIYNWDKGISEHKPKIPYIIEMVSYHQKTEDTGFDVLFFETIISQKIKFYDKLNQYRKNNLHFFINNNLGADRMVVGETIDIVKELNNFVDIWKSIYTK